MDTRDTLYHLPLEPYKARYTEMLHQWEQNAFGKLFNVERIQPKAEELGVILNIGQGEVLDSVMRPRWAMAQMMDLLKRSPIIGNVWFSDFFHPGLEALPYSRSHFKAYSYCWAQTFDKYDFTHKLFLPWMRPWEHAALEIYSGVFVACDLLKELITTAAPHVADKVHVVGLPFDSSRVQNRLRSLPEHRQFDVVYSSRFDQEKNPSFFLDLVESASECSFAICTGHNELRGTDIMAVKRAKHLAATGRIQLFENCSKEEYYNVLSSSHVQFNCALQDWVSFTLLEALTFGCKPLYPHFRAFPETLWYQTEYLYIPDVVESAHSKLSALLDKPADKDNDFQQLRGDILSLHDGSLDRITKIIAEQ